MAIKPTDCVVWLNKIGHWKDSQDWEGNPIKVYCVPDFWIKFQKNVINTVDFKKIPWQRRYSHEHVLINQALKSYNAEFKMSKKDGGYLKFRSESDYTFFVIKWS